VFMLENLNLLVDHPGTVRARGKTPSTSCPASTTRTSNSTLICITPRLARGILFELVTSKTLPWIGEIQVADVPGRQEPGTGGIALCPRIASELVALEIR